MKRFHHWALALSLTSSLFLGMATPRAASALSEAEVFSRLSTVPVFTLVDDKGAPILGSNPEDKDPKPIILFFVHQKDAQAALESFRKAQPEKGKQAQVLLLSMKDALESFKKIRADNDVVYSIEPNLTQLQSAINLLKTSGEIVEKEGQFMTKEGKPFMGGVPLFYAMTKNAEGKEGFISGSREVVVKGKKQVETYVPVYFSQADLDRDLATLKKEQPDAKVETKVTMFSSFLAYLYNAKSDADVPFRLIPSDESAQFANSLLENASQNPDAKQEKPKK